MEPSMITRYYTVRKFGQQIIPRKDLPPASSSHNPTSLPKKAKELDNIAPQEGLELESSISFPKKSQKHRSEKDAECRIFLDHSEECLIDTGVSKRPLKTQFHIKQLFRLIKKKPSKALISRRLSSQTGGMIEKPVLPEQSGRRAVKHPVIKIHSIKSRYLGAFHLMTQSTRKERFGLKLQKLFKDKYNRKSSTFENIFLTPLIP